MPRPERRPRVDSYGKPLPELAPVEAQALFESAINIKRRTHFYRYCEDLFRTVMRRGWFGELWIRVRVKDGTLLTELLHRYEQETHLPED